MRWLVFLLLPVALCLSAAAQTQSPVRKPTGVIAGRVTANEKPISDIKVILHKPGFSGGRGAKITDREGKFQFTNLAAGHYAIKAEAYAYVYNSHTLMSLEEGESITDVEIALTRGGVITGRVTDAEGRPLIKEPIYLFIADERGEFSSAYFTASFSARTDDRGIYRVFGLSAGRYLVALGRDINEFSNLQPGGYYRRTYHPDTAEKAKAKVIEVSEGREVTGVDIVAGRVAKTYSATGRVIHQETGKPVPHTIICVARMQDAGSKPIGYGCGDETDVRGNFSLRALAPGRYSIRMAMQGDDYSEPLTIEIINKNITGVEIKAKKGTVVDGFVTMEGTDDPAVRPKLSQVELIAFLTAEGGTTDHSSLYVNSDGSFRVSGLMPGKLNLHVSNMIRNLYLLRLEHNGGVQPDGISITAGENIQNVKVVLAYGNETLRGQVKVENGAPPPGAQIFLSLSRVGSNIHVPSVTADGRGRFMFERLPAGEYEISASGSAATKEGKVFSFSAAKQTVSIPRGPESQIVIHLDTTWIQ